MRVVKLRFNSRWYRAIDAAARKSGQTVEAFLSNLVATACPPPTWEELCTEEAVARTLELCASLEQTKYELLQALSYLVPKPGKRTNPHIAKKRRHSAALFTNAIKRSGLRYREVAQHIGVSRPSVSRVANGTCSLPPAWSTALAQLFGENWMTEQDA